MRASSLSLSVHIKGKGLGREVLVSKSGFSTGAAVRRRIGSIEPFRIAVSDTDLADLRERLVHTRLGTAPVGEPWESGVDYGYLRVLLDHWRTGFDWRAREEWINSFPQFRLEVAGTMLHFVRVAPNPDTHPDPTPLIVSHGWPYSFVEMLALVPHLPDFAVVVPSLPGYGFSEPLSDRPFTSDNIAPLWHRLMTEVLGYERYFTYGEDVGCGISDWLGALYPESVAGIFATHPAFPPEERRLHLTEAETRFIDWLEEKWRTGRGYAHVQGTRPDTLAVGLDDSPAGMLAWIVEKLHEWSGPEFDAVWPPDDILTTVSLYWFTRTIGSSFLPYYHGRLEPALPQITVPVGVSVHWGERGFPREYAERTYLDIRAWKEIGQGGHFTAKQTPELVAADLREFVDSLP